MAMQLDYTKLLNDYAKFAPRDGDAILQCSSALKAYEPTIVTKYRMLVKNEDRND